MLQFKHKKNEKKRANSAKRGAYEKNYCTDQKMHGLEI